MSRPCRRCEEQVQLNYDAICRLCQQYLDTFEGGEDDALECYSN